MKTINLYILEKLKINKNSQINKLTDDELLDVDPKDYLFVVPYGDGFQDLADKYGETYIVSKYDETAGWILPKEEADNEEFVRDYDVFIIPDKYDTIIQFMRDYEGGHIKLEDLKLI